MSGQHNQQSATDSRRQSINLRQGLLLLNVLVLALVVASALGVIYSSYYSRQLFSELQQSKRQAVRLEENWGRLLLEQSTWASHSRIERLAKSELNMVVPAPESTVVIRQ